MANEHENLLPNEPQIEPYSFNELCNPDTGPLRHMQTGDALRIIQTVRLAQKQVTLAKAERDNAGAEIVRLQNGISTAINAIRQILPGIGWYMGESTDPVTRDHVRLAHRISDAVKALETVRYPATAQAAQVEAHKKR